MFTILILLLDLGVTGLAIYVFDYQTDALVNNGYIITLSILIGLLVTASIVWLLLELFYLLLPSNTIQKSLFTHKLLKQIVSVPIHLSGKRIRVIGKEHLPKDTGFTIYSNHNTWDDPIIIAYGLYNYTVAALGKEDAFNIPVVGKLAPKFGCVMIHRDNPRQSAKAINQVVKHVQEGLAMVIFPEGTRNKDVNSLLEFKAGAFKVALRTGKPLVPITLVKSSRKYFFSKITIQIHKPILFDEFHNLNTKEIAMRVKISVRSALQ